MFDTLTERLTQSLRNVTGSGQLTEDNIKVSTQNRNLHISLNKPEGGYRLQMFNIIGENVFANLLNDGENNLDVSSLPSGVYVVRVADAHTSFSKKIILQ